MATPAAAAAATVPTIPPPAATPPNKKEFPTLLETAQRDLAAKGRLNTQYHRLLTGIVRTYTNPIEQAKKDELLKRMIEEAKNALDSQAPKVAKKEPSVKQPGIETKVSELTERVNNLIGKICEQQKAFENTKKMDDLQNVKIKESTSKETEPKLIDRNREKIIEFIGKNNELMNDFVKIYKTLKHKIATKTNLIAEHITIEKSDEAAVNKFKKKWHLKDDKVKSHFAKQDATLKRREDSLKHLTLLNTSITEAFAQAQKEIHYLLDCWVNKTTISRTTWRNVGNAFIGGYKTDPKILETMNRIENIKGLLPKPVGKPAAAEKDTKAEKKEEKKEASAQEASATAAATPAPAAAAPATAPAEGEKKKKKKKHKEAAVKTEG